MDAVELKEYIFTNNQIEQILESVGCHSISSSVKEIRCGLPEHRNKTSVVIKKTETLKGKIYKSEDAIVSGDIITIVMDIASLSFPNALKYIHGVLGIEYKKVAKKVEKATPSPLDIFKKIKRRSKKVDISEIEICNEDILMEYTPNLTRQWLNEGIVSFTAREFNIGFDYTSQRIIIVHKSWRTGDAVGVIGRTIRDATFMQLFDIPKYLAVKPYPKSLNVYGLFENYQYIQEAGYCIVYESEKSVLKRHSRLDKTGVAICGHTLSDEQVRILIGLDVDIILAYDSDISIDHIKNECEKFRGIRNISYIINQFGLLGEKESPADKHDKIFKVLFNRRIKYLK